MVTPGDAGGDCGCDGCCDRGGMTIGGVTEGIEPAGPHGEAQPAIAIAIAARGSNVDFGERAKAGFSAGLKL
jgi:hypothetical protein